MYLAHHELESVLIIVIINQGAACENKTMSLIAPSYHLPPAKSLSASVQLSFSCNPQTWYPQLALQLHEH